MSKKENAKKLFAGAFAVCLLTSGLSGCGDTAEPDKSQAPAPSQSEPQSPPEETGPDASGEVSEPEDEKAELKEALNEALDGLVMFDSDVRNDVTGRWRLLRYSSGEDILDHAVEYYNAYFEADDEVHVVVNFGLQTTTVINVFGGSLFVDVHEYVDKEEHDAKVLGGGALLKSYEVDIETGEVEDLSDAPEG